MHRLLLLPVILMTLPAAMCSTAQPAIEVRTVEVATPVPCVNEDQLPAETPASVLTGNAVADTAILKAETLDLRAENGDLRALIVPGCTIVD